MTQPRTPSGHFAPGRPRVSMTEAEYRADLSREYEDGFNAGQNARTTWRVIAANGALGVVAVALVLSLVMWGAAHVR